MERSQPISAGPESESSSRAMWGTEVHVCSKPTIVGHIYGAVFATIILVIGQDYLVRYWWGIWYAAGTILSYSAKPPAIMNEKTTTAHKPAASRKVVSVCTGRSLKRALCCIGCNVSRDGGAG